MLYHLRLRDCAAFGRLAPSVQSDQLCQSQALGSDCLAVAACKRTCYSADAGRACLLGNAAGRPEQAITLVS